MTYLQKKFAQEHQHRYFADVNDGVAICLCGKVKGSPKAKTIKYQAKSCWCDGYMHDSTFGANYAMALDWRKRECDIHEWERHAR